MKRHLAMAAVLLALSAVPAFAQATWIVDDDGQASIADCDAPFPAFATPQAAIDAAADGDTVLVCPGSYLQVQFGSKSIALRSVAGPATTILDGEGLHPVVMFLGQGPLSAVLEGFTVRNGFNADATPGALEVAQKGGGIWIFQAHPIVRGNVIVNNQACGASAIWSKAGPFDLVTPLIDGNTIADNADVDCGFFAGGGAVSGALGVIRHNTFRNNDTNGAIVGGTIIERNTIHGNTADRGGALTINAGTVSGNLIFGNHATVAGGGIYASGGRVTIVNNTIAGNDSPSGSGIYAVSVDPESVVINNLVIAAAGETAIVCADGSGVTGSTFRTNDVYSDGGAAYGGCADQTGVNGNISTDPKFTDVAADDYRLLRLSPAVDAGTNTAPRLTSIDIGDEPRIFDGNLDDVATVDMGADEYLPFPLDATRDFSGDGTMDLFFRHATTGELTIWAMRGVQRLVNFPPSPAQVNVNWRLAGSGDFNGDGKADLLWQEEHDGDLFVWFMDQGTRTGSSYLSVVRPLDPRWRVVSVADLSGDGKPDLVWQHADTGTVAAWLLDGTVVMSQLGLSAVLDPDWHVVGTGDFDGDGKPDLLWKHASQGYLIVWLMDGVTRQSVVWLTPGQLLDVNWEVAAVGDLNGDGHVDIVFQHRLEGRLTAWLMNRTVRAASQRLFPDGVRDPAWLIAGPR